MFSLLSGINPKIYLVGAMVLFFALTGGYIKYLKSDNEDKALQISSKDELIKSKDTDIQNIISGYEATLEIEREKATQKAITQEQKEVVVTKYKTLTKTIEKRGKVQQNEKDNFTIVNF